jgi:hypothetical protein
MLYLTVQTPDVKGFGADRPSTSSKSVHSFAYDRVFDEHATQREIYENAVHPVVISALEGILGRYHVIYPQGYNSSVIAYGQTGTGKTHTIEGELDGEQQGIIPRAATEVCCTL